MADGISIGAKGERGIPWGEARSFGSRAKAYLFAELSCQRSRWKIHPLLEHESQYAGPLALINNSI